MKYYILLEKNFEYTDEYYYPTGGGYPRSVFTNRAEAEKELENRTIKDLTGNDRWGGRKFENRLSYIEWDREPDFKEELSALHKNWEDKDFFDKLELEDKKRIVELFKDYDADIYEIVEVEGA